jgi:pSer/pThr/pTyr-binding forkhead associated (FHA) protein
MQLSHRTTRHAIHGDTVLLDDGSRNGTWHNGQRVTRAVLRDGDTVVLGGTELGYVEVVEAATDPLELIAA